MADQRIIFAGGGGEEDARPLDETFATWVGQGRLLSLPNAMVNPISMQASLNWLRSVFSPLGVTRIDAWFDLAGHTARHLAAFDALYIGGGNTFYLLNQIRVTGLATALIDFINAGHPVYGGSAGAIILAKDITPCAHIDEDIVGLKDLRGLDLALGTAVWCHYSPADDERIQAYVRRTGVPSLAASERAGVMRVGDDLFASGYDPVYVFDGGERREVRAAEKIF